MAKKKERKYSFPTVSVCPRCKSQNTKARSTQDRIQYRQCLNAICRIRYHVTGTPVEKAKSHKEPEHGKSSKATETGTVQGAAPTAR